MNFHLFKNDKKTKETQPDYLISAKDESGAYKNVGGGWVKEMKNGRKYISCKVDETSKLTPEETERLKNMREQAQQDFDIL